MQRGEAWLINLDPTVGAEIRKTRPVVIVSDDAMGILPLRVIVPITEWKDRYAVAPAADAFQVRSVSRERFVRRIGRLSGTAMQEITRALALVLGVEVENPNHT